MVFGAVILAFWCASAAVLLGQSCQGLPGATTSVTTVPYMVFLAWSSGHVNTDAVIPRQLCYRRSSPRQRYTAWLDPQRTHVKKYFPKKRKGCNKSETTYEKLSTRKVQICQVYFCVILFDIFFQNNFPNDAPTKIYLADLDGRCRILFKWIYTDFCDILTVFMPFSSPKEMPFGQILLFT